MKILKELKFMVKTKFLLIFLAIAASSGASYAAGSKKMFSLDNTDFVVLISFLIFVGILIYFKVPSIIASFLDNRSNEIQNEMIEGLFMFDQNLKLKLQMNLDLIS